MEVLRNHLNQANGGTAITDEQFWKFLRNYHILVYDLDIRAGITHALMHSLIGQYSPDSAKAAWALAIDEVQIANQNAGTITKETLSEEYKARQFKTKENAKNLSDNLAVAGYDVMTGGTDNHMILINVGNFRENLTGATAQKCLEDCGIVANKITLPYDKKPAELTSGIRLGTPIVTRNGMGSEEMSGISVMIDAPTCSN